MHVKTAARHRFSLAEGLKGRLRTTGINRDAGQPDSVLPRGFTLVHSLWRTGWCHRHRGPCAPRPLHVDLLENRGQLLTRVRSAGSTAALLGAAQRANPHVTSVVAWVSGCPPATRLNTAAHIVKTASRSSTVNLETAVLSKSHARRVLPAQSTGSSQTRNRPRWGWLPLREGQGPAWEPSGPSGQSTQVCSFCDSVRTCDLALCCVFRFPEDF